MNNNSDNISVSGAHTYHQKPIFNVKMILSLDQLPYEDQQELSFQDLKDRYMGKLVDNGIAGTEACEIIEDAMEYALMNFAKEGTVLICKTRSLALVEKILKVQSEGVFKQDVTWEPVLTNEEMNIYFEQAFQDAKSRAEGIAKSLGRTIGRTQCVEDYNLNNGFREALFTTDIMTKKEYLIKADFELI